MISLFDFGGQESRLPQAMVTELVEHGGRHVSLLEFAPIEVDAEPDAAAEIASDAAEFEVNARARQVSVMIEAAREAAYRDAWERCTEEQQTLLEAEQARVESLFAELARDRTQYFAAAEQQAVRLALAIARKVLAREAQADPMLLCAKVKVALSKVQDGSVHRLLVAPGEGDRWRATLGRAEGTFEVRESEAFDPGTLRLETSVGEVELGIRAQLEVVERNFTELFEEQAA